MNINTATRYSPARRYSGAPANSVSHSSPAGDRVTLSSTSTKELATMTMLGSIPVAGVVTNLLGMVEASGESKSLHAAGSLAGIGANAAGTAAVVYGLSTGNWTATFAGLGLLGASGIAAGATAAALR